MKSLIKGCTYLLIWITLIHCSGTGTERITNPILPGYYADPSLIIHNDTFYIYATIDPWGGDELAVLESHDFKNWQSRHLNWPTKMVCTSSTSWDTKVWAPSVVRAKNGDFYMYVSVGSEIWVGVSNHPLGPWKNPIAGNKPLIARDVYPEYHMIDAECFTDTDGQCYLYWGSGLNWVNGHCFVGRLKEDMTSFDGEMMDITPPNYFEAPFMIKRKSKYYLMYSDGKVTDHTYKIRYSIGDSPYGPWEEGKNSPILETSDDLSTFGPGHHAVFCFNEQDYILYHRHAESKTEDMEDLLRELCIDSLNFTQDGFIKKVIPKGVSEFALSHL